MHELIHISEASSLAIHSLALLAGKSEPMNATLIAKTLSASRNHVAKVLQVLVKHDYLGSARGPLGGFRLKKSPESVSLLEIMEIIEGKIKTSFCSPNDETCPFAECVYGGIRERLTEEAITFFSNRKLIDINKIKQL